MSHHPAPAPAPNEDPCLAVLRARLEAMRATLRLAQTLAESGERVDLGGLDEQAGPLCAGVLDLPQADGRALRADLILLRDQVGALAAVLRANPPDRD